MNKMPKNACKYICIDCNFKCSKISNYDTHLLTSKHKNRTVLNSFEKQNAKIETKDYLFYCKKCNKGYNARNSLWYHEKVCNKNVIIQNVEEEEEENIIIESTNDELIQEKDELIQYLISENKEFKNLILEIVKKDTTTNNNNIINNTNSHNKTFNLQFFLNETCKDAMNMSEFIESVKIQLSDLENVGKLGFVDGISNIIIKNLQALDVEKRPVHCCDAKRETMYIKDQDKWEKEDHELKQMRELVRYVRDKNISMVNTWRDLYPECIKSDSKKTTQFNQIYMESFGGEKGTKKEKEEKIISRIAKAVIIDK
jgi:hypothetical protein